MYVLVSDDRMPGMLILHAVEVADVGQGTGLTPAVAAAIGTLAAALLADLGSLRPRSG
jgi:hydrogenase maturation protease